MATAALTFYGGSGGRSASGGEGGIRTHGTVTGTTVFETVPIDHSGTSPLLEGLALGRSGSMSRAL